VNGEVKTGQINHKLLAGLDMGRKDYYADWNQYAPLGDTTFNLYKPVYGTVAAADMPVWDRSKDIRVRGVMYNNSYNALYLQDELSFFDNKLRLTLAGRYTTSKDVQPYRTSDADHSKFTPRVGLSYSITKNTSVYAVFDEVFLPNFGADWQKKSFDPVTGDNIEFGFKRDWMGGKWNSALSVYQVTKNNLLIADLEHRGFNKQSGQQRVKGVEVDIKGQVTRNLEVVINYAYSDAKFTKDSKPEVVGNQVPGTSKHIHNSWVSYKVSDGKMNGLRFSLGYQYLAGRSAWFIFDKAESPLPEYFRLDGGISYSSGKLGFNFNVNNILSKYLFSGAPYISEDPFTKIDRFYWQAEPKINSRLTVSYKF
jgi:iron complex outermembrane recepter protein